VKYLLLLVNADGVGTAQELIVREFRTFPGDEGISVHFRPVRKDALFQSAKAGSGVAYKVLLGEGLVRSQVWVEYEVRGPPVNIAGRSADLLFALALLTSRWTRTVGEYPVIAATGVLDTDEALVGPESAPAVVGVDRIEAKLAAAVDALAGEREGVIFYPAADRARAETWCATAAVPPHIRIHPAATLDDALSALGIQLEKVYLGNPYRGLEYFDYAHRSVFFGREGEIRELTAQLLRREAAGAPGVLVEGASGSGKSSFLRAGVLPALINPHSHSPELESALGDRPFPESVSRAIWYPALVPSGADEETVVRSIHRVWQELPQLAGERFADTGTFEALLQLWRASWPKDMRFVWLVDQLEELLNLGLGEPVVESFGEFLLALQVDGAWSLASGRADAVPHLKRYASWRRVFGSNEGQYYLPGLGPTALDEVICRPAKVAGLTFGTGAGGRRLDRALREDAYKDHENALPLLQLTLQELYRRRSGRELTYARYEELGGLSGAVATIASAALKDASPGALIAASRLFRALVTVDESGSAIRRYALRTEIAEDPAQEQLLAALVNRRLCVSTQREGRPVVALAHEAVLRTWPELVDWLREEFRLLQLRELAEHDARLWQEHGRSDTWLVPPRKLAALEPLTDAGVRLSGPVGDFIQRSRHRMRRAARLKQAGISAVVLLAIAASVTGLIAVSKQREAQYQAAQALRARDQATIAAATARATATFLATIFNAPTPERSLGRLLTARELLDAGAQRLRTSLATAPEVRARLTEQIGNAYREIGEYGRAAPLLASAIEQYRALPNAPLEDRAEAYLALGQLYRALDKWPDAATALTQATALEAQLPAARRSAMPDLVYARIETDAGDYRAAQALLERAGATLRNAKRPPDLEDYLLQMRYSQLYVNQGRLEQAERAGLEALAIASRITSPESPPVTNAVSNLANVYDMLGDRATAEQYDRRAMLLARTLYGTNSLVYALMLDRYGSIVHELGNKKQAESLDRRILLVRLHTLGLRHRLTAQSYLNLATDAIAEGRWSEGLALVRRALAIFQSLGFRDRPDTAYALAEEAKILIGLGRPAEAIPVALHSVRLSQQLDGLDPANAAGGWFYLGNAYAALGRYRDAANAMGRAVKFFEQSYGTHRGQHLVKMLDSYSNALRKAHRFDAARAALASAAAIRDQIRVAGAPTPDLKSN
jgi:tetratricopeptide (TPR) repeat protein